MYLFPALTCEPVIGSLEAFTKGILRVFEAVLTEPESEHVPHQNEGHL